MSTIGSVGQSASALSAILSPPAGLSLSSADGAGPAGAAGATQPDELLSALQRDVDYAFKNGKSLDEIGKWLNQRISATLRNHGVSESQRQSVLDQLQQVFAQGGSKADVRQSVEELVQTAVANLDPAGASSGSADGSMTAEIGQNLDFTA